jgi:hypothetical protein
MPHIIRRLFERDGTMTQYTIGEAAEELGIDRTTLERRMRRMKITAHSAPGDGRYRYLIERDVERIRDAYKAREKRPVSDSDTPTKRRLSTTELYGIIDSLQTDIADLRNQLASRPQQRKRPSDAPGLKSDGFPGKEDQSSISDSHEDDSKTQYIPLPDDWIAVNRFCIIHGWSTSTIFNAIDAGRVPPPYIGKWRDGSGSRILKALDRELRQRYLDRYPSQTGKTAEDLD